METWRGSISAVNQCGDHLFQEFPQYESGELKNSMSKVNERWTNITNRSKAKATFCWFVSFFVVSRSYRLFVFIYLLKCVTVYQRVDWK